MRIGYKRSVALAFMLVLIFCNTIAASGFAAGFPIPEAAGVNARANDLAEIDYSHVHLGYVKVRFFQRTTASVRVLIEAPGGKRHQYRLSTNGDWEVFPLTDGNGRYTIGVFQQIQGNRFAMVNTVTTNVRLDNEFEPFLRPNQFVNFTPSSQVVREAERLTHGLTGIFDIVGAVYNFVIDNIAYDFELAATVQSGYVPDLDRILQRRMGICFDYAALMTGMLRSQGIPTRLVIGYAGDVFHAWINVYSPETGWINSIIQFNGRTWNLMDPTFSSTSNGSPTFQAFIGDGTNYNPTSFH
ncbi:MAG: transglutaminase-like domain-containing protein [Defluviitaleaceae bacterium]|nr:transglutaminase-like domain-containing protein [Defluviitaleaceae bacterium]